MIYASYFLYVVMGGGAPDINLEWINVASFETLEQCEEAMSSLAEAISLEFENMDYDFHYVCE